MSAVNTPTPNLHDDLEAHAPQQDITDLNLNILIYGSPGTGKTLFSGTAADLDVLKPVFLLDVEAGSVTVRNKDLLVVPVRSIAKLIQSYNKLSAALDAKDPLAPKTVIVDNLTEVYNLDMRNVMEDAVKKAKAKGEDRDPDVPGQREYLICQGHLRKIVRKFRDLPCNVIFTALAKQDKDEETGAVTETPALPGKLAYEIPAFIDIVGYLHTKVKGDGIERRMLLQPTRRIIAKDRLAVLGNVLVNPTMPDFIAKLNQ